MKIRQDSGFKVDRRWHNGEGSLEERNQDLQTDYAEG